MRRISVLYINAMGPRRNTPQGGGFVTQRIRALTQFRGIDVIPVYPFWGNSLLVKVLLHMKGILDGGAPVSEQMGVKYDIFTKRQSLPELFLMRYTGRLCFYKSRSGLEKILLKYPDIQLIHMHWIWPYGAALPDVAAARKIPYIVTCHGSDINISMRNEAHRKYIMRILDGAYKVEFVSHALLNTAKELGYSGKNAMVVYNGIDTKLFCGKRISHSVPVVGYVGNLLPVKGVDRLPGIFQEIYQRMEGHVRFVVAGDGGLREQLENDMGELPVDFLGFVSQEEMGRRYAEMDVLLLPSRNEGYGCVIKEAQACGVIPVGCDVGGVSEAIGAYGAAVSDSGDERELMIRMAEAAVGFLTGKKRVDTKEMIREAMECSWQERQRDSVAVYLEALGIRKEY